MDKLKELSDVFCIDVCAYAVLSNHYHLVLKINNIQANELSNEQVIQQWMLLFNDNVLIQRYLKGNFHNLIISIFNHIEFDGIKMNLVGGNNLFQKNNIFKYSRSEFCDKKEKSQ